MDPIHEAWLKAWGSFRAKRIAHGIALIGFLPGLFLLPVLLGLLIPEANNGAVGVIGCSAILAGLGRSLWTAPCPRCGRPFGGWFGNPWPDECDYCGLRTFALPPDLAAGYQVRLVLGGRILDQRPRRIIALFEVLGGLALLILWTWFATTGKQLGLFGLMIESFAVISMAAGVLLWRDIALGYELSEFVQLVQTVRFQFSALGFAAAVGPEALLYWSQTGPGGYVGIDARVTLGAMSGTLNHVAIDLIPIAMFILVRKGRLALRARERSTATTANVESGTETN